MKKNKKPVLLEGSVAKTLISMTIPMLFASIGNMVFNIADTFFIGQLGTKELAAMGFTFPVVVTVGGLMMSIGIGSAAVVSIAFGEGNHKKIGRLTTDSLLLSMLIGSAFTIAGLLSMDTIFTLMGASPEVLILIREYMIIWFLSILTFTAMVGNGALRAIGAIKTSSGILLTGIVINIILDPLLIFGIGPFPRLELAGAAYATVASRLLMFILVMWTIHYKKGMLSFEPAKFKDILISWKRVLFIAMPTGATSIILPISMGVITGMIAVYGTESVAAYGVGTRIDNFLLRFIGALSVVLGPFVGQNLGAKKYDRVKLSIKYSKIYAISWGVFVLLLLIFAGKPIASLFSDDPEVINKITTYFYIIPIGYGFQGVLRLGTHVLSVLNKPVQAAILIIAQSFICLVLAHTGSTFFGLKGIFYAVPISFIISGIASHFWLNKFLSFDQIQD